MNALVSEWKKIAGEIGPALPGLGLVLFVALVARFVQGLIPDTFKQVISEILVAVVIGLVIRNTISLPASMQNGITFALHRLLRLGIILLGLRLSLQDVIKTGGSAFLLIIACIVLALSLAFGAGRLFNLPLRLATLIGVGTAICGNSAIVATAPVIEAKEDEVGFAVATITLFGLIAVIFYPLIGQFFHLSDRIFGIWAGTAVNDTSQVVATATAYSQAALNIATVVKLTRNTMIAPLIVLIGILYRHMGEATRTTRLTFSRIFPWFVLGFLGMSLLRTAGVAFGILPQSASQPGNLTTAASILTGVDEASKFLILMALSAIGLGTKATSLRAIGFKPFLVGLSVAGVLAAFSLAALSLFGL